MVLGAPPTHPLLDRPPNACKAFIYDAHGEKVFEVCECGRSAGVLWSCFALEGNGVLFEILLYSEEDYSDPRTILVCLLAGWAHLLFL